MTHRDGLPTTWTLTDYVLLVQVFVLAGLNATWGTGRSLWLDETLTYWVSQGSFANMAIRAFDYQGQLPLYFALPWISTRLFGVSEFALRLPSVLAFLLCSVVLYRLGCALHGRQVALTATVLFNGMWAVTFGAPEARPYTVAVLWLLIATYCLVRWTGVGRSWFIAGYVVSLLAAVYTHVLFASALAPHALFVAARHERVRPRRSQLLFALAALAVGLLPAAYLLQSLRGKWDLYSFTPMPSVFDLIDVWRWLVLIALIAGLLLLATRVRATSVKWISETASASTWLLLLTWSIWPALLLFSASHLRGESVFVWRYSSWQVPGIALLSAVTMSSFSPAYVRRALGSAYFCAFVALILLQPAGGQPDWRAAVKHANTVIQTPDTPVLVWSGLVESENVAWAASPLNFDYMLTPASYYGLKGTLIPTPSPVAVESLHGFLPAPVIGALEAAPTVVVLAPYMTAATQIANWVRSGDNTNWRSKQFGPVTVIWLDREQPPLRGAE
jgi:uncharacterized membrane protein